MDAALVRPLRWFREKRVRWLVLVLLAVLVAALATFYWRKRLARRHRPRSSPAAASDWQGHPAPAPAPFVPAGIAGHFIESVDASVFQRGSVHAHSNRSDGEGSPEEVYAWYRDHGYNFVALSDHNVRVDPAAYASLEREDFVLVAAEEVTMRDANLVPVHLNAICSRAQIGGGKFPTVTEALRWGSARISEQGAIDMVNHPNLRGSLGPDDLIDAKGAELLEIWSGQPSVHSDGDANRPSEEALWDVALTRGLDFGGVAVDDLHHLSSTPETEGRRSGPGRGWIEVFAEHAVVSEICEALRARRFIASNGAGIGRIRVQDDTLSVTAKSPASTVDFIGSGGALLDEQIANVDAPNVYRLRGGEGYVRARVTNPDRKRAWTQAYRVEAAPP